jgi:2-haloacid dehalogenase
MVEAIYDRVPLGILSNADHKMLHGALDRNKISGLFVHVLSAEDIRMYKPRPEIYQMACEKFSLRPDEILFVSSNTWDVAGAKSYGLTVAWLNRSAGVMDELGFEPDIMVEEIAELLGVLN